MELCVICSIIETNPDNDIRKREIHGKPVCQVIQELFGLKIDAEARAQRRLPHTICAQCIVHLTTAYSLRWQVWRVQAMVDEWEHKQVNVLPQPSSQIKLECDELDNLINMKMEAPRNLVHQPPPVVKQEPVDPQLILIPPRRAYDFSTPNASIPPNLTFEIMPNASEITGFDPSKGFTCAIGNCGARFEYRTQLNNHERLVHGDNRPFQCHECHQRFKNKHHLNGHLNVHGSGKEFVCKVCNKNFKWERSARKHIRIKHPECPVEGSIRKT